MQARVLITTIGSLLSLVMIGGTSAAAAADMTDNAIEQAVSELLSADEAVGPQDIQVEVRDGVATLSGSIDTLYERRRAARLAGTIKGVRAVVNATRFQGEPRADEDIRREVTSALFKDAATELHDVKVEVDDAQVTLRGVVDSHVEQLLCVQVARDVRGVRGIVNRLEVETAEGRPDPEIKLEIARRFRSDVWLDERLIRIDVDGGKVRLLGVVGSVAEKETAEIDAWVAGVRDVDVSELEVDWSKLDGQKRSANLETYNDLEIRQAVLDALRYDPRVNRLDIQVAVRQGTVTLEGSVSNLAARRAAERDARRSIGVAKVTNRLQVVPRTEQTDEDITADIKSALARDQYVTSYNIGVRVTAGVAVLSGQIDTELGKRRAETVTERVPGVVRVVNELRVVQPDQEPSDRSIKYVIENRIYWSPFLDEEQVSVFVDDGAATLNGFVRSSAAFETASKIALEAGADEVNNQLVIRHTDAP